MAVQTIGLAPTRDVMLLEVDDETFHVIEFDSAREDERVMAKLMDLVWRVVVEFNEVVPLPIVSHRFHDPAFPSRWGGEKPMFGDRGSSFIIGCKGQEIEIGMSLLSSGMWHDKGYILKRTDHVVRRRLVEPISPDSVSGRSVRALP